jgi:hypothetical protein
VWLKPRVIVRERGLCWLIIDYFGSFLGGGRILTHIVQPVNAVKLFIIACFLFVRSVMRFETLAHESDASKLCFLPISPFPR